MLRNPLLLDRSRTGLLVIDIQEKILAVMAHPDRVVENTVRLIKGFKILGCPVFATEQYPEGIGKTVGPIKKALDDVEIREKVTFSCCGIEGLTQLFRTQKIGQLVLCGIESHVCVWQTAMDLVYDGFIVSVPRDTLSSRNDEDNEAVLNRMRAHGIEVTTTETVLFELVKEAGTDDFKKVAKLIK